MRHGRLVTLILVFATLLAQSQDEEKVDPNFFPGGESDIESSDPRRGSKALQKWSRPDGKQGDDLLSEAPFFWDHRKVGEPVFLRIIKNDNRKGLLELWIENRESRAYELYKTYRINYFSGKAGPKTKQGDLQAPEGFYYISRRRLNPNSRYHLSMDMGYPNAYDRAKGYTGNYLMIHGSTVSIGCFAMTDCSIEQIYTMVSRAISGGQGVVRVHSFPFVMSEEKLSAHRESPHYDFWKNLKEGWDWFEENKRPPNVEVEGGKYIFSES